MNFETVLKGAVAVVSFFDPWATLFWKALGVLDTNLVPGAHDPLVSVEAEVETNRKWYSHPEPPHTKPNEPKCIIYGRIGPRLFESVNQERIQGTPRYASSLRGGGWGQNCYRGCRDLNVTRTGWIIKQAALKTGGQGLWVSRVFPWATLRSLGSVLMLN